MSKRIRCAHEHDYQTLAWAGVHVTDLYWLTHHTYSQLHTDTDTHRPTQTHTTDPHQTGLVIGLYTLAFHLCWNCTIEQIAVLDILLSVVRCCVTNCHSTECLAPCGAVAAFLQCALYMLLVLRPCTFSCRFCLVLLLVHGDFRVDFHVCSHCTVSYRFWLTLRTLCTWTRTRVLRSTLTLSCSSFDDVVSLLCSFSLLPASH